MPKINAASLRRIATATRVVELSPRNRVKPPGGPRIVQPNKLGISTTEIGARSSKSPGSGTVQPYTYDVATDTLRISGEPLKVRNWTGTVIDPDVWVEYHLIDGHPFLNGNDCSGVAP